MAMEHAGTILVVAEDSSLRALLRDLLSGAGYGVLRAADGERGLRLAERHRPVAVLLDVGFPPSAGAEVLTRLGSGDATARIPVVALTDQPAPVGDGARPPDGWIEKPFDIDVLLERVGRVAGRPAPMASPARAECARPTAAAGGA